MSYDSRAVLADFAERRRISFPLLSDPGSMVIARFGLLNPAYPPGDNAHGVPYPGTFVTDPSGTVTARFFEAAYAKRRTSASLLALAGDVPRWEGDEIRNRAFVLRTSQSNRAAAPGQRLTLVVDFEMLPEMHAYAPGATGYRALELRLEPNPLVELHETVLPASRPLYFAPLKETVPVFEGRFRLTRDVSLAGGRDLAEALKAPEPRLEIRGRSSTRHAATSSATAGQPAAELHARHLRPFDRERSPKVEPREALIGGALLQPATAMPCGLPGAQRTPNCSRTWAGSRARSGDGSQAGRTPRSLARRRAPSPPPRSRDPRWPRRPRSEWPGPTSRRASARAGRSRAPKRRTLRWWCSRHAGGGTIRPRRVSSERWVAIRPSMALVLPDIACSRTLRARA